MPTFKIPTLSYGRREAVYLLVDCYAVWHKLMVAQWKALHCGEGGWRKRRRRLFPARISGATTSTRTLCGSHQQEISSSTSAALFSSSSTCFRTIIGRRETECLESSWLPGTLHRLNGLIPPDWTAAGRNWVRLTLTGGCESFLLQIGLWRSLVRRYELTVTMTNFYYTRRIPAAGGISGSSSGAAS